MISRIETSLRRWRRRFSRSEWMARLLKLSSSDRPPSEPGLVLIQIDGLAYPQLRKALKKGEMPFLKRLLNKEHYHLEHLYPGVPSTTPAVQAEIFYGLRQAVPAFCFMMRETQQLVRMYEPEPVVQVENKIKAKAGNPLLKGGSCYLSIFRAGTADGEAHFCPASEGWGPALRSAGPLTVLLLILGNFWGLLRGAALIVIESVLALVDSVRGVIEGQDLMRELMFVPTRVAVTILMRELCTTGVKIDIARGLPIIYVNLLGYDEQSHRRGPSSAFAHWTLKGIDDAIGRIWRAAHRSERRHYDVWIYSDHGQENTTPYEDIHGRSLGAAIADALSELPSGPSGFRSQGSQGVQLQRARMFGSEWIQKLIPKEKPEHRDGDSQLALAALGPVALLYNVKMNGTPPFHIARLIVEKAQVPLVLYKADPEDANSPVFGWCADGPVRLPEDGERLLGRNHPFLHEAAADLAQLCRHPDAGDFVMLGWIAGQDPPLTFADENGSHAGAGPNETHAFALMPADIAPPDPKRGHWRPEDLHRAAHAFLGHVDPSKLPLVSAAAPPATVPQPGAASAVTGKPETGVRTLRVMTYNVHSCRGVDGKLSPERIARVIARYGPDVVALQELDVRRPRSGHVDQAEQIARILAMEFHFHPALHLEEERYGDAILSRLPMHLVKKDILPGPPPGAMNRFVPAGDEPRGALWVEVEQDGMRIQVMNTHLGLSKAERLRQVEALLSPEWLAHPRCHGARILMGDFNAMPNSAECKRLAGHFHDAQLHLENHRPLGTFFSRLPKARIDHVFVDRHLKVTRIQVPSNELTRLASDHLPLIVDLELPEQRPRGGEIQPGSAGSVTGAT